MTDIKGLESETAKIMNFDLIAISSDTSFNYAILIIHGTKRMTCVVPGCVAGASKILSEFRNTSYSSF